MNKKQINLQAGQAPRQDSGQAMMIATIFFLIISITIIFGLAGPITRQQKIVSSLLFSRQSYFLAEAGLEDVIFRLDNGMSVGSNEVLSLNGSSVTTVTTDTIDGKEVVSESSVANMLRKIEATLIIGAGVAFHYGIQTGVGGFQFSNNAGVNGNVYSNGSISGSNGAFITGDAVAVGSVSGVNVGGQIQTGATSESFPISDTQITTWKDEALAGGTVDSQSLSGTNNVLGPKKIQGNLNLSNSSQLTVNGTLWITGNLTLSNNAILRLSSSYGANDGIIIVDGVSTLSNGSDLYGSGTSGSYIMLLSTSSSSGAVVISNNATAVIIYAPNGTVQLSNSALVKQITAKTISLSNNAVITYEQGLASTIFTSGPSGGYDIDSWKEVE